MNKNKPPCGGCGLFHVVVVASVCPPFIGGFRLNQTEEPGLDPMGFGSVLTEEPHDVGGLGKGFHVVGDYFVVGVFNDGEAVNSVFGHCSILL